MWSFNPCSGGILLLKDASEQIAKLTNEFQSLFWWNTSTDWPVRLVFPILSCFNPCSGGILLLSLGLCRIMTLMAAFQSLFWWNTSTESAHHYPIRYVLLFQSLFWWNTSTDRGARRSIAEEVRFQSLFWWNTSTEGLPGVSGCGLFLVSILVLVEYFY